MAWWAILLIVLAGTAVFVFVSFALWFWGEFWAEDIVCFWAGLIFLPITIIALYVQGIRCWLTEGFELECMDWIDWICLIEVIVFFPITFIVWLVESIIDGIFGLFY